MNALELGIDRGRITIPIRDATRALRGLLRYQPQPTRHPKMLAAPGSRLGLIPHPSSETSKHILLVEGPPDMIAARSHEPPRDRRTRRPRVAARLGAAARRTTHHDRDGRRPPRARRRRADRPRPDPTAQVQIVDLAPGRDDGYDLTDWLLQHGGCHPQGLNASPPAASLECAPSGDD